jgi:methionine synthase II (cobalamin-independent)
MSTHTPYRYDYVGSFLRPEEIKQARADFAAGKIDAATLRDIENKNIVALIKKQKEAGYHVITDGEYRRAYWHLDFMWRFNGVEHIELDHGYFFHGEETTKGSIRITGKITGDNHPFVEDYKFVKQFEDEQTIAKQTIPAPAQMLAELYRGDNAKNTKAFYPNEEDLIEDIAKAYHQVILDLYDAGCRNVQLDDCTWGMIVDERYWKAKMVAGARLEEEAEKYLRINNLAIANLPEDLYINTHICRGNYHSTYACTGAYDRVAPYVFAKENVQAFYLEFDDERSGSFEALKYIPKDKKVVLGLVTTKKSLLERKENIIARIKEASKYVPLENLYLSPQCGFASCEIGNKLTDRDQWAKLSLVKEIAEEVWA